LQYLGASASLPEWSQATLADWADPPVPPTQRIPPSPFDLANEPYEKVEDLAFAELWLDLIEDQRPGVLRGSGKLKVNHGSDRAELVDSSDEVGNGDIGREVFIEGDRCEIVDIDGDGKKFILDHAYDGHAQQPVIYALGATRVGPPWNVRIPTSLVVLAENRDGLRNI
jgi:hypothetical protein